MAKIKITVALECMECGRIFSKPVGLVHAECPKCGSYDIDMAKMPDTLKRDVQFGRV